MEHYSSKQECQENYVICLPKSTLNTTVWTKNYFNNISLVYLLLQLCNCLSTVRKWMSMYVCMYVLDKPAEAVSRKQIRVSSYL